jgi:hypothetical protein
MTAFVVSLGSGMVWHPDSTLAPQIKMEDNFICYLLVGTHPVSAGIILPSIQTYRKVIDLGRKKARTRRAFGVSGGAELFGSAAARHAQTQQTQT